MCQVSIKTFTATAYIFWGKKKDLVVKFNRKVKKQKTHTKKNWQYFFHFWLNWKTLANIGAAPYYAGTIGTKKRLPEENWRKKVGKGRKVIKIYRVCFVADRLVLFTKY